MKKRMLTMLLALVMIICVLPFAAMAAEEECDHSAAQFRLESKDADCSHEGAINYFCKECGKLAMSQAMPGGFGPHNYGTDSACDICGAICKHKNYGTPVTVPATCTVAGTETKTCTECGYESVKTLKAGGHKFTVDVVGRVATCTVDGYSAHKACSKCGEPNDDYTVIPAGGHDLETVKDTAATCTKNGTFEEKCNNCEYVNTVTRKKTGHTYTTVTAVEPTCTEKGHNAYKKCITCGSKKGYASIAALGHSYVNGQCVCGAVAPDYSGTEHPDSSSCAHTKKSVYITSADCTQVGYTVLTCDACHTEISREIRPATGHTEKTVHRAPTCTEDGFERVYCAICSESISFTEYDRLGHNYVNGICTRCGDADSNKYTSDFQDVFIVG